MPKSNERHADLLQRLTAEVRRIEGLHHRIPDEAISTGCMPLDRLLPAAGLRRGTLVEWLAPAAGSGAATLALLAGREACRQGGVLAVLDASRGFYPPAAAALGIDLERLLVVRPAQRRDEAWALDQLLRSPAVGAALAWPGDWEEQTFRRLQLAAESGAGLGFLLRPSTIRGQPSWAELRLLVEPLGQAPLGRDPLIRSAGGSSAGRSGPPARLDRRRGTRRWQLKILRIRGAQEGATLAVELDERTGSLHEVRQADSVHLAPLLAAGAAGAGSRRA